VITVRGFIFDVDTGKLEEVSCPVPMGSFSADAKLSSNRTAA
jgi:hypothetical protein